METFADERFFITNASPVRLGGEESCFGLSVYPFREWAAFEERLLSGNALGLTSAQLDGIKRWIVAPAIECTADKLGRVLVPPHLRKSASLERDIVFVGSLKKVELWSQAEWERVTLQAVRDIPIDTEALASLGL